MTTAQPICNVTDLQHFKEYYKLISPNKRSYFFNGHEAKYRT